MEQFSPLRRAISNWKNISPVISPNKFIPSDDKNFKKADYEKYNSAKSPKDEYDCWVSSNKLTDLALGTGAVSKHSKLAHKNLNDPFRIEARANAIQQTRDLLQSGIPSYFHIDYNGDGKGDHWFVVVGMDSDDKGIFFRYFENAASEFMEKSEDNRGTTELNKVYVNRYDGKMWGYKNDSLMNAHSTFTVVEIRGSRIIDRKRFTANFPNTLSK
jgi:hypothetical protein